mmetsp:Transcript_11980/g.19255  ORF Transcript_11980/g.19255 Transcript_11980/m.19255 type:complete len:257 (-) Transcript_11980:1299-2069(-)
MPPMVGRAGPSRSGGGAMPAVTGLRRGSWKFITVAISASSVSTPPTLPQFTAWRISPLRNQFSKAAVMAFTSSVCLSPITCASRKAASSQASWQADFMVGFSPSSAGRPPATAAALAASPCAVSSPCSDTCPWNSATACSTKPAIWNTGRYTGWRKPANEWNLSMLRSWLLMVSVARRWFTISFQAVPKATHFVVLTSRYSVMRVFRFCAPRPSPSAPSAAAWLSPMFLSALLGAAESGCGARLERSSTMRLMLLL